MLAIKGAAVYSRKNLEAHHPQQKPNTKLVLDTCRQLGVAD
jgi:hypothetical protein